MKKLDHNLFSNFEKDIKKDIMSYISACDAVEPALSALLELGVRAKTIADLLETSATQMSFYCNGSRKIKNEHLETIYDALEEVVKFAESYHNIWEKHLNLPDEEREIYHKVGAFRTPLPNETRKRLEHNSRWYLKSYGDKIKFAKALIKDRPVPESKNKGEKRFGKKDQKKAKAKEKSNSKSRKRSVSVASIS